MSTFTKQIDATIRDVDHTYDSGTWYFDQDSAWNIGYPGLVTRNIGLRFTNVTIQQGATINSAKIRFNAYGTESITNMKILIQGIDEDNTSEFVASPESSARTRTKTTAHVHWEGTISYTDGGNLDTPDITDIVKEIVDRSGWSSGNAMAFFVSDNGSSSGKYISVNEYGDGSSLSAQLIIDYVASTTTNDSRDAKTKGTDGANDSRDATIQSAGSYATRDAKLSGKDTGNSSRDAKIKGTERGNYGLKITKPGHDVKTETDIKNMIFTSARGVLGLRDYKEYTYTTDANGAIDHEFPHYIGYAPIVIVQVTTYDSKVVTINPTEWHSYYVDYGKGAGDIEVTESFDFSVSDTGFTMKVTAWESDNIQDGYFAYLSNRSYTFKVYYYFNEITDQ